MKDCRGLPLVISNVVIVCHLFMATNQVSPLRRQERSITSLFLSSFRAFRTDKSLSRENSPLGNKKEVIMTYYRVALVLCVDCPFPILLEPYSRRYMSTTTS